MLRQRPTCVIDEPPLLALASFAQCSPTLNKRVLMHVHDAADLHRNVWRIFSWLVRRARVDRPWQPRIHHVPRRRLSTACVLCQVGHGVRRGERLARVCPRHDLRGGCVQSGARPSEQLSARSSSAARAGSDSTSSTDCARSYHLIMCMRVPTCYPPHRRAAALPPPQSPVDLPHSDGDSSMPYPFSECEYLLAQICQKDVVIKTNYFAKFVPSCLSFDNVCVLANWTLLPFAFFRMRPSYRAALQLCNHYPVTLSSIASY